MTGARLEMTFRNEADNRFTLSVQDPKPDLTPQEVQAVMEQVVTGNVFASSGGDLTGIVSARIVSRTVEELF